MTHTPAVDSLEQVIADLTQPRTLSQFMGAHDMALALVEERAEIAGRLAALTRPAGGSERLREAVLSKLREVLSSDGSVYRDVAALLASPQGAALARTKADQEWDEWAAVLRRLIGDRTEKLHFAADVQATVDGVRFDNCRFIRAKPDGYIHMGQYIESCDADDRHAGWQPVWTSKPIAQGAEQRQEEAEGSVFDMPMTEATLGRVNVKPLLRALADDCREQGDADVATGIGRAIDAISELMKAAKAGSEALDHAGATLHAKRLHAAVYRCGGLK